MFAEEKFWETVEEEVTPFLGDPFFGGNRPSKEAIARVVAKSRNISADKDYMSIISGDKLDYLSISLPFMLRDRFVKEYTWAIPSKDTLEAIKGFAGSEEVVEVGAGSGLWARLLQNRDVKVTPVDVVRGYWYKNLTTYTEVRRLSPKKIKTLLGKKKDKCMFLCWPSYDQPWAYEAVKEMAPSKVIYIGEGDGGCCADEKFFEYMGENYEVNVLSMPSWPSIHDHLRLYTRKCLTQPEGKL